MDTDVIRITGDGSSREVREEGEQAVHKDAEQKWTETTTLWSTHFETFG